MAAGDVSAYVGVTDMTLMYPVTDIAGLNRLSRTILANAAHAMAGMLLHPPPPADSLDKPSIGLSMFGVTTPCVQAVRACCRTTTTPRCSTPTARAVARWRRWPPPACCSLVVDITTTEVGQHLVPAACATPGPTGLDAAARHGLPWVGSVGALDMINWGEPGHYPRAAPWAAVSRAQRQRDLMRSNAQELQAAGPAAGARSSTAPAGPVRLLLPLGGLSMLDAPGQPFHDPHCECGAV
jgi:uncharacterized protein (UPF0261 family)